MQKRPERPRPGSHDYYTEPSKTESVSGILISIIIIALALAGVAAMLAVAIGR